MSSNVDSTIHTSTFWTAGQACAALGIRPATLYAYVSRGLLASLPSEGKGRARRYLRDDVLRLKARHDARAGHAPVAAGALRWGEPVLDTSVGDITLAGPRYRGILAVDLARAGTPFETVAELIWTGSLPEVASWPGPSPFGRVSVGAGTATPLFRLGTLLSAIAARDKARFAVAKELELDRARRILGALPWILAPDRFDGRARSRMPIAARICRLLGAAPTLPRLRAIDAALVVCADHELNVSTFAVRVVASSGADVHACLAAGAAALTGPLHGGATERVEALLDETRAGRTVRAALEARARRAEQLPGLGHPLYPNGDPRAWLLLELAFAIAPRNAAIRRLEVVARTGERHFGRRPTVDLGLVAVAAALGAPSGTAGALFAIGRTAGWVAHAIEQREAGFLLRPRARYVGPSGSG